MHHDVRIRLASVADAAQLTVFAERTFRETFAADNRPSDIDLYCALSFSEATQAAEIADPSIDTLIATDPLDTFVGYAQLRAGQVPSAVPASHSVELARLYVDRTYHGRGLARRLIETALPLARQGNAHTMWLGVWEHNLRAQAFYRKMGFVDVGAHEFRLGIDRQIDRLMVKTLA